MKDDELERLLQRVIQQRPYDGSDPPASNVVRDYLAGELSDDERIEFEQHLQTDPELKSAVDEAKSAMEWYRREQPALRSRLESRLRQQDGWSGQTVNWSELVGAVEDRVVGMMRSMLDAIATAAPSQPLMQPAASFRAADQDVIEAVIDKDDPARTASFTIVRAQIEADGRCTIEISASDPMLRRTDESAYRCRLALRIGDTQLVFQEETVDKRGNASFVVNFPIAGEPIKIQPEWLRLEVQPTGAQETKS